MEYACHQRKDTTAEIKIIEERKEKLV